MLRKTMIVLTAATALTAGVGADAFARGGGGGGHAGGFGGGGHMGGGHFAGAGRAFGGSFAGHPDAGMHGHFDRDRGRRFGSGYYDYGCGYEYPYYNPYSCYTSEY